MFSGELFSQDEALVKLKNILLDFFHGQDEPNINLTGFEHVVCVTAGSKDLVHFRVYSIQLKKSGQRLPRVELEEMGPSLDLEIDRTQFAPQELWKQAIRMPKELRVLLFY